MGTEDGVDPMRITRAQLMTVIRQRVEELTAKIEEALKSLGFTGPVGRQVVLTGGGAELKNIADYMQGVLGRSVRVGRPKQLTGLPDAHSGPGLLDARRPCLSGLLAKRRHPRPGDWQEHAKEAGDGDDGPPARSDEGRDLTEPIVGFG